MDYNNLPAYLANARQLLFDEGHLNQKFIHLENTENECNKRGLVYRCVYIFLDHAEDAIKDMEEQLNNTVLDLRKLEDTINRFRSCINTLGAAHMLCKLNRLGQLVRNRSDTRSMKYALAELKLESDHFENEMDGYFLMLSMGEKYSYDVDSLINAGLLNPVTLHLRRR
ncbi:pseudo histidine-containing phosphotransfer protein 2-like [Apium graveolens]|uniref:pseudo histidine-containing phosphotransfer protein 2-like n=1 Tax=Apium graveolens TaxID=4045 RepID=UPI003D791024